MEQGAALSPEPSWSANEMKHAARIMPSVCATNTPLRSGATKWPKPAAPFAMRSFSSRGALTAISLFTPTESHLILSILPNTAGAECHTVSRAAVGAPAATLGAGTARARFLLCGAIRPVTFGMPVRCSGLLRGLSAPKQRQRVLHYLAAFCNLFGRVSLPAANTIE